MEHIITLPGESCHITEPILSVGIDTEIGKGFCRQFLDGNENPQKSYCVVYKPLQGNNEVHYVLFRNGYVIVGTHMKFYGITGGFGGGRLQVLFVTNYPYMHSTITIQDSETSELVAPIKQSLEEK